MFTYIFDRLKERSTWLGIIGLACSAGVSISPENTSAIATIGTTIASAISTFVPDKA